MIGDRYDDVLSYESGKAWSAFFRDIAGDCTWIVYDKRQRLLHMVCATDND